MRPLQSEKWINVIAGFSFSKKELQKMPATQNEDTYEYNCV